MKKIIMWVVKFLYKVSGVRYVVEEVRTYVFNYKLRLRFVPVTYKLFILSLGVLIGSSTVFVYSSYPVLFESKVITFENVRVLPVEAKEIEAPEIEKEKSIEELADYIWNKESTRGKNNFSKCEAVGKINSIGYGIPGNGEYRCFDSHEEEMKVLEGWLISKKALGWSETKMLCIYSGNNYSICK